MLPLAAIASLIVTIVTYFCEVKRAKITPMRDKAVEKAVSRLIDEFVRVRMERQISHEALAKAAGVHRSTISLIESKKRIPTILTCLKISKALGLSLGRAIIDAETK